jgi:CspA family cold shock protein
MAHGTVKFFNVAKGFGFITADEGGKDVFVPTASITAAKIAGLKTGQRVSFDSEPDKKGPKAINLVVIAEPEMPKVQNNAAPAIARAPGRPSLTLYMDPSSDDACDVLDELRDAGHEPRVVDYIATPPSGTELRRLSMMLQGGNLVRKYDPLFMALQLDDRFISDTEFWGAIHEHPTLINGPVLANGAQARLCRSAELVETLLAEMASGSVSAPKPKVLSDRLLQMVAGNAVPPRVIEKPVEKVQPVETIAEEKPVPQTNIKALVKTKVVEAKAKAKVKVPAKAPTKAPAKAKPVKPAAKPAKKSAKKK